MFYLAILPIPILPNTVTRCASSLNEMDIFKPFCASVLSLSSEKPQMGCIVQSCCSQILRSSLYYGVSVLTAKICADQESFARGGPTLQRFYVRIQITL